MGRGLHGGIRAAYKILIFSDKYIRERFADIARFENVIEKRQGADLDIGQLAETNRHNLEQCLARGYNYILIDDTYPTDIDI